MSISHEDILAGIKSHILEEYREFLCQNLNPRDHFPYLRSKFILNRDDEEKILHETTTKDKAHLFLDILLSKGPRAFVELVASIIHGRTQVFVAEKLNTTFEERKSKLTGFLQSKVSPNLQPLNVLSAGNHTAESDLGFDVDSLPKPTRPKPPGHGEKKDSNMEAVVLPNLDKADVALEKKRKQSAAENEDKCSFSITVSSTNNSPRRPLQRQGASDQQDNNAVNPDRS